MPLAPGVVAPAGGPDWRASTGPRNVAGALNLDLPAAGDDLELARARRRDRWQAQETARRLWPEGRVSWCSRRQRWRWWSRTSEPVSIWHRPGGRAYYRGLMRCGNVHTCPVCAETITRARAAELTEASARHLSAGGGVLLVTVTWSHGPQTPLADQLARGRRALRSWKGRRRYRAAMAGAGVIGSVRSWEVTYGRNGWHPHCHQLVLTRRALSSAELDALTGELWDTWQLAASAQDLRVERAAFRVEDAPAAAAYIAKWSTAAELIRAPVKRAGAGLTPWQLLDQARRSKRAGALWREYARAFEGVRLLWWSAGLRDRLQLGQELFDLDVVQREQEQPAEQVCQLSAEQWYLICRRRRRADLLDVVERGGWPALSAALIALTGEPARAPPPPS